MAFNTKVDVADTELEADETVTSEAEDVTLEDEALVEAEPADDADEDEMHRPKISHTRTCIIRWTMRKRTSPRTR